MKHYILKNREIIEVSLLEWGKYLQSRTEDRVVKHDVVYKPFSRPYRVSTVFLGIDHQYGDGPTLLFETMIFVGEIPEELGKDERLRAFDDIFCDRYSTYEEAEKGHETALNKIREKWLTFKSEPIVVPGSRSWTQGQVKYGVW